MVCVFTCVSIYRTVFLQTVAVVDNKHGYVGRYNRHMAQQESDSHNFVIPDYGREIGSLNSMQCTAKDMKESQTWRKNNEREGGYQYD